MYDNSKESNLIQVWGQAGQYSLPRKVKMINVNKLVSLLKESQEAYDSSELLQVVSK